jgi:hypothetical protein
MGPPRGRVAAPHGSRRGKIETTGGVSILVIRQSLFPNLLPSSIR